MQHEHSLRYLRPQSVRHLVCGGTVCSAAGKPAKTLRQWAADESADIVYNLALFNMTGQGSDRYGVIKGRTLQYLKAKGRRVRLWRYSLSGWCWIPSNAVSGWKLADQGRQGIRHSR